jgi:hypothetical protein
MGRHPSLVRKAAGRPPLTSGARFVEGVGQEKTLSATILRGAFDL